MMRDTLQLSHAVPYKYSLVQWEAENFLAKWLHGLGSLLPGNSLDEQEKIGMVMEYFRLGEEEERAGEEKQRAPPADPRRISYGSGGLYRGAYARKGGPGGDQERG